MRSTYGSYLAILEDGSHDSGTGRWGEFEGFKQYVRKRLHFDREKIAFFWYAWGREWQLYNPAEVAEVFFGPEVDA